MLLFLVVYKLMGAVRLRRWCLHLVDFDC